MNMKSKDFTPKKELKDVKRLDTRRKRINEKAFIENTIKSLSFDNNVTISALKKFLTTRLQDN